LKITLLIQPDREFFLHFDYRNKMIDCLNHG